jgi:hypothetical protein
VALGEGLGADGLGRRHEVLDDGPEDLELAVVQHAASPPVGTRSIECQVYGEARAGARSARRQQQLDQRVEGPLRAVVMATSPATKAQV